MPAAFWKRSIERWPAVPMPDDEKLIVPGLAFAFAILGPPHWLALRLLGRRATLAPILFHRVFLRLFSVRVTQSGTPPAPGEAALVLANHVSWLDIVVIGSLRPLSFVAKSEIAGWPVIGTLARLQRTVFIDRARRGATATVNSMIGERVAAGELVVLFAEGTTGDGLRLLPFRSSLVGAAREALTEMRTWVRALSPVRDADATGVAAFEAIAESFRGSGLEVTVDTDGEYLPFTQEAALLLYRTVQEGLTNVSKFARTARVEVFMVRAPRETLARQDGRLVDEIVVTMADDGPGADLDKPRGGLGLIGMRERVEALGGEFHVASKPEGGFLFCARVPAHAGLAEPVN